LPDAKPARRSSALSLPNLLTYGRIAAVPAVVGLLFWPNDDDWRWLALAIYTVAAITDYFDGYLARTMGVTSALGRMLDPIADKLLVSSCLLMLVADGTIAGWALWAAIIILCREILVSGLREFLAELKVSVPVSNVAKWKTTVQIIAVGTLIGGPAADNVIGGVTMAGIVLLWVAAALTLYTGFDYMKSGVAHILAEDLADVDARKPLPDDQPD
jgi:cardiolipin synthase (CMP-forming)